MQIKIEIILYSPDLHEKIILGLIQKCFDGSFVIIDRIELISDLYPLANRANTVYIDCSVSKLACKYCQLLVIKPMHYLPGLKLIDIQQIGNIFHLRHTFEIYQQPLPFNVPQSMMNEDLSVFNAIKTEIHTSYNRKAKEYPDVTVKYIPFTQFEYFEIFLQALKNTEIIGLQAR